MTQTINDQDASPCPRCQAPLFDGAPCSACMLLDAQAGTESARSSGSRSRAFAAPSIEALSAALPAYEVQTLIGQGGMGAVYRARHRKLDRLVAIKILRPIESDDPVLTADFTERFEREARVLAKLDHPHIVRIYDFGRTDPPQAYFYLILEYVDGASLRDLMSAGRLTPKEVLELIPQVCEALQSAHHLGVIHRDIKPENILVDAECRVRIADFGLAKLQGLEPEGLGLTQSHQTFGSVHYMAPEQLRSAGQVDHRADLYSLGVIVYEMLTGELPLGRFAAPSTRSGGGKGLDDVVFRALESEPDARYQGAGDLKRDLEAGELESKEMPLVEDTAPAQTPGTSKRQRPHTRKTSGGAQEQSARVKQAPDRNRSQSSAEGDGKKLTDLARSWSIVAVLALAYSLEWIEIPIGAIFHDSLGAENFTGAFSASSPDGVIEGRGNDIKVMGIPVWLGFLGVLGAAFIRLLENEKRKLDPRIPFGLGAIGCVMMGMLLVEIVGNGLISSLRIGWIIAALAFGTNTAMDVMGGGLRGPRSSE